MGVRSNGVCALGSDGVGVFPHYGQKGLELHYTFSSTVTKHSSIVQKKNAGLNLNTFYIVVYDVD